MIHDKRLQDSIFTSGADVLVNPVNCMGVSGAGLARMFAQRFPEQQKIYENVCRSRLLVVGKPLVVFHAAQSIAFFPTKNHFKAPSQMQWIKEGLEHLKITLNGQVNTVAFPAIGCGLGGLRWADVRPLIVGTFPWESDHSRHVFLYPPR